jgi:hypothetical protein
VFRLPIPYHQIAGLGISVEGEKKLLDKRTIYHFAPLHAQRVFQNVKVNIRSLALDTAVEIGAGKNFFFPRKASSHHIPYRRFFGGISPNAARLRFIIVLFHARVKPQAKSHRRDNANLQSYFAQSKTRSFRSAAVFLFSSFHVWQRLHSKGGRGHLRYVAVHCPRVFYLLYGRELGVLLQKRAMASALLDFLIQSVLSFVGKSLLSFYW